MSDYTEKNCSTQHDRLHETYAECSAGKTNCPDDWPYGLPMHSNDCASEADADDCVIASNSFFSDYRVDHYRCPIRASDPDPDTGTPEPDPDTGTPNPVGGGGGGGGGGGFVNRPPAVEEPIPDRTLRACRVARRDLLPVFRDRDLGMLDYAVEAEAPDIVEVRLEDETTLLMRGLARGMTRVTVYATDSDDATGTHTFGVTVRAPALVPLFPGADDEHGRQGFVRIIDRGGVGGTVSVEAIDDRGLSGGSLTVAVPPGAGVQFNSDDLEQGNPDKGLSGRVRNGRGNWRLLVDGEFDFELLSYIRTDEGFLTSMHDLAPGADGERLVVVLNPGSNTAQVGSVRLLNRCAGDAEVSIAGTDEAGAAPGTAVRATVPWGDAMTLSAFDLETGMGVQGVLGDGAGKWRLRLRSEEPVVAMSLLSSPTGHLTNLSTMGSGPWADGAFMVPLFAAADDPLGRQGFVRVVNRTDEAGEVRVRAYDDAGTAYGPLTLTLGSRRIVPFNSDDLETGNPDKGLSGATGPGTGDWRLALSSDLDIEVHAYMRTRDGFLTSMHEVAPQLANGDYWVAIFNPGSNAAQVSTLRLVNPGSASAAVTIVGVDDAGASPGTPVNLTVPPGAARTLAAWELESGTNVDEGALGDGAGKWRMTVASSRPIIVLSLLSSPTGHLTNLSTAPGRTAARLAPPGT